MACATRKKPRHHVCEEILMQRINTLQKTNISITFALGCITRIKVIVINNSIKQNEWQLYIIYVKNMKSNMSCNRYNIH